jgi:Ca-activated chloride channel family protein
VAVRSSSTLAAALLALALAASSPAAPAGPGAPSSTQRGAIFRGAVEVVDLHVTVTDASQHHVTGLSQADFQVLEDGVPQQLSLFIASGAPVSLSLMIDTSGSMHDTLPIARAAALRVLDALREGDRARIVGFSNRDVIRQDFTDDVGALRESLAGLQASGSTALYRALYVALKELRAEKARGETRRLALVLLSDGLDTASSVTDEQILELARGSDVAIYPIALHPRRRPPSELALFSEATYFLTRLAADTGGRAFFCTEVGELDAAYLAIATEIRAQYSLAYSPTAVRPDGWRRILVRTPGREGLLLRHRRGYFARSR